MPDVRFGIDASGALEGARTYQAAVNSIVRQAQRMESELAGTQRALDAVSTSPGGNARQAQSIASEQAQRRENLTLQRRISIGTQVLRQLDEESRIVAQGVSLRVRRAQALGQDIDLSQELARVTEQLNRAQDPTVLLQQARAMREKARASQETVRAENQSLQAALRLLNQSGPISQSLRLEILQRRDLAQALGIEFNATRALEQARRQLATVPAQNARREFLRTGGAMRQLGRDATGLAVTMSRLSNTLAVLAVGPLSGVGARAIALGTAVRTLGPALVGVTAGLAATGTAVGAFTGVLFGAEDQVREFEKTLSRLSALTGFDAPDLEALSASARAIGGTTTLGISEVAEGFRVVGSLRPELIETREALVSVTRAAATLAEGAGIDLNQAARAVASTLNQFGLDAADTGRVVDVLSESARRGAATIPELTASLAKAGSVASALGLTLEQTTALIQVMSELGLTAEETGTGLRNLEIVFALQGATGENLFETLRRIREENQGLEQITGLVNRRQVAQALTILNNIDRIEDLAGSLNRAGAAQDAAGRATDNLTDEAAKLGSSWERLKIVLGDTGPFRSAVGFLDDLVSSAANFFDTEEGRARINIELAGPGTIAGLNAATQGVGVAIDALVESAQRRLLSRADQTFKGFEIPVELAVDLGFEDEFVSTREEFQAIANAIVNNIELASQLGEPFLFLRNILSAAVEQANLLGAGINRSTTEVAQLAALTPIQLFESLDEVDELRGRIRSLQELIVATQTSAEQLRFVEATQSAEDLVATLSDADRSELGKRLGISPEDFRALAVAAVEGEVSFRGLTFQVNALQTELDRVSDARQTFDELIRDTQQLEEVLRAVQAAPIGERQEAATRTEELQQARQVVDLLGEANVLRGLGLSLDKDAVVALAERLKLRREITDQIKDSVDAEALLTRQRQETSKEIDEFLDNVEESRRRLNALQGGGIEGLQLEDARIQAEDLVDSFVRVNDEAAQLRFLQRLNADSIAEAKDKVTELALEMNRATAAISRAQQQSSILGDILEEISDDLAEGLGDAFASAISIGEEEFFDFSEFLKDLFRETAAEISKELIFKPVIEAVTTGAGSLLGGVFQQASAAGRSTVVGPGGEVAFGPAPPTATDVAAGQATLSQFVSLNDLSTVFGGLLGGLGAGATSLGIFSAFSLIGQDSPLSVNAVGRDQIVSNTTALGAGVGGALGVGAGFLLGGGGAAAGSAAGATFGSAAFPVIGTAIGAILGAISGIIAGEVANRGPGRQLRLSFAPEGFEPETLAARSRTVDILGIETTFQTAPERQVLNPEDILSFDPLTGGVIVEEFSKRAGSFQDDVIEGVQVFGAGIRSFLTDRAQLDAIAAERFERESGFRARTPRPRNVLTFIRDAAEDTLVGLGLDEDTIRGIIGRTSKFGEDRQERFLEAVEAASSFDSNLRALSGEEIAQAERAIDALGAQFRELTGDAQLLGKPIEDVTRAFEQGIAQLTIDFDEDIGLRLLALDDPLAAQLIRFDRDIGEARLREVEALGGNVLAVETLNARERLQIIEDFAERANSSLQRLLNDIREGDIGGLGPIERLANAEARFNDLRERTLAGDLAAREELAGAATNVLRIAREEVFGSGTGFGELRNLIEDTLVQAIAQFPTPEPVDAQAVSVDLQVPELVAPQLSVPDFSLPELAALQISVPEIELPEIQALQLLVPDFVLPEFDALQIVVPEIELPEIQALQLLAPDFVLPEFDAIQIVVPELDALQIVVPDIELPELDALQIVVPDFVLPEFDALQIVVPEIELPEIQALQLLVPDIELPEFEALQVVVPEIQLPEIQALQLLVPDFVLPEFDALQIVVPEIELPELEALQIVVPEIELPEIQALQLLVPDIVLPELDALQLVVPEVELPEFAALEISVPEILLPEVPVLQLLLPELPVLQISVPAIELPEFQALQVVAPEITLPDLDAIEVVAPELETLDVNVRLPDDLETFTIQVLLPELQPLRAEVPEIEPVQLLAPAVEAQIQVLAPEPSPVQLLAPELEPIQLVVPEIELPELQALQIVVPELDALQIAVPEIDLPELDALQVVVPELQALQIVVPELAPLQLVAPEISAPTLETPELTPLQVLAPELSLPALEPLQLSAPEIVLPALGPLELLAPELQALEISAPELEALQIQVQLPEDLEALRIEVVLPDALPEVALAVPEIAPLALLAPEIDLPSLQVTSPDIQVPTPELPVLEPLQLLAPVLPDLPEVVLPALEPLRLLAPEIQTPQLDPIQVLGAAAPAPELPVIVAAPEPSPVELSLAVPPPVLLPAAEPVVNVAAGDPFPVVEAPQALLPEAPPSLPEITLQAPEAPEVAFAIPDFFRRLDFAPEAPEVSVAAPVSLISVEAPPPIVTPAVFEAPIVQVETPRVEITVLPTPVVEAPAPLSAQGDGPIALEGTGAPVIELTPILPEVQVSPRVTIPSPPGVTVIAQPPEIPAFPEPRADVALENFIRVEPAVPDIQVAPAPVSTELVALPPQPIELRPVLPETQPGFVPELRVAAPEIEILPPEPPESPVVAVSVEPTPATTELIPAPLVDLRPQIVVEPPGVVNEIVPTPPVLIQAPDVVVRASEVVVQALPTPPVVVPPPTVVVTPPPPVVVPTPIVPLTVTPSAAEPPLISVAPTPLSVSFPTPEPVAPELPPLEPVLTAELPLSPPPPPLPELPPLEPLEPLAPLPLGEPLEPLLPAFDPGQDVLLEPAPAQDEGRDLFAGLATADMQQAQIDALRAEMALLREAIANTTDAQSDELVQALAAVGTQLAGLNRTQETQQVERTVAE